jgi:hypothetical protein
MYALHPFINHRARVLLFDYNLLISHFKAEFIIDYIVTDAKLPTSVVSHFKHHKLSLNFKMNT